MTFLRTVWQEALGLFVDDGALAALCVCLVLILTVAVLTAGLSGLIAGVLLGTGCVGILVWSVLTAIPR
jgi:hypothetical protein